MLRFLFIHYFLHRRFHHLPTLLSFLIPFFVSIRRTAYFKVGLNPVILRDEKTRRFKDARALRRVAAIGQE
ncbi:hypothetical protein, partial [Fulvivirga sp. M361]|uniref:hypothetical protein n=1 Tax=Fulvivirga sp. M361 TaxID=2594266 RepID=UPI001C8897FF